MLVIEHKPWVGSLYETEGVRGQRLGIVGYSAWTDEDSPEFTIESVANVVSGEWRKAHFYSGIASYFGMSTPDFYERVVMFEFVPCAIGGGDARYAKAMPEQEIRGRSRMLEIAEAHGIEKLLVFSVKGWNSSPPTLQVQAGEKNIPLGNTSFRYGHYEVGGRRVTVAGLRHPQYAPRVRMTEAVDAVLAL